MLLPAGVVDLPPTVPPFGSPAVCERPVALRTGLAAGVPFVARCILRGPEIPDQLTACFVLPVYEALLWRRPTNHVKESWIYREWPPYNFGYKGRQLDHSVTRRPLPSPTSALLLRVSADRIVAGGRVVLTALAIVAIGLTPAGAGRSQVVSLLLLAVYLAAALGQFAIVMRTLRPPAADRPRSLRSSCFSSS